MPAPQLLFDYSGTAVSAVSGFDYITITFESDIAYQAFECRATKTGQNHGRGIGRLVASFGYTPAGTRRTFEVYDTDLVNGEGEYRISLYAQGEDGGWNDNCVFQPFDKARVLTSDGKWLYCMR